MEQNNRLVVTRQELFMHHARRRPVVGLGALLRLRQAEVYSAQVLKLQMLRRHNPDTTLNP